MNERIAQLEAMVAELMADKRQREFQQLSYPLDDASTQVILEKLPSATTNGNGTTALTQSYNVVGGGGGSITGPKAYTDTILIVSNGTTYEVPYVN